MKCQMCDSPATVHLTEISGGIKKELHLCQGCAAKQGVATAQYQEGLSAMLAGIANTLSHAADEKEPICPHCGMSPNDFRSHGKLGCAEDYSVFSKELMPLIDNLHAGRPHKGKRPARATAIMDRSEELNALKAELKAAISRDDFERAAVLRDRIYSLGGRLGEPNESG